MVVVNNTFENRIFIYDRVNRIEYTINNLMPDLIFDIKNNNYAKKDLYVKYDKSIIKSLFDLNVLILSKQKDINNVKI